MCLWLSRSDTIRVCVCVCVCIFTVTIYSHCNLSDVLRFVEAYVLLLLFLFFSVTYVYVTLMGCVSGTW